MSLKKSCNDKPSDVLIVGDSMIKRLQVYGHPVNLWKFCYPGGTAEEMNCHISTEKLPGEALIGAVLINMGTNDLSRSRNRIRTLSKGIKEPHFRTFFLGGSRYKIFVSRPYTLTWGNIFVSRYKIVFIGYKIVRYKIVRTFRTFSIKWVLGYIFLR